MDGLKETVYWHGEDARATVGPAKDLPPNLRAKTVYLSGLFTRVKSRGKGQAAYLMSRIIERMDELDLAIMLEPLSDEEEIDSKRLQTWYAKLGFVVIQQKTEKMPCLMLRLPLKTTPKR